MNRANCSYAYHDGEIQVSGGMRGANLKRTTLMNLRNSKMEPMQTARCAHAPAFFADTYFIGGGQTSNRVLDTLEQYFFFSAAISHSFLIFHLIFIFVCRYDHVDNVDRLFKLFDEYLRYILYGIYLKYLKYSRKKYKIYPGHAISHTYLSFFV